MKRKLELAFLIISLLYVTSVSAFVRTGTIISAPVTVGDSTNTFPSAYADEMHGGYKIVSTEADRDLITAARRAVGMLCFVVADNKSYRLVGGIANANWQQVTGEGSSLVMVDSGSGLTGGPITISGTISVQSYGITTTHLGTASVTAIKLDAANSPSAGQVLSWNGSQFLWSATGGTGTVTTVETGVGLVGGPINTTGTISLDVSGVTPGYYSTANITVDAYGRVIAASSGAAGVGTVTQVNSGAGLTGGPISTVGTLAVKYDDLSIGLNGNGSLEVKNVDASRIGDGTVSNTEFSYLNNATGELQAQINNISSSMGDITGVTAGTGLTGGGTSGNVTVALDNYGVNTTQLATAAVTADKIAVGQVVTGLSSSGASVLHDNVTLTGGSGISLVQAGQNIQITATSTAGGTVSQVNTGTGLTGGPITSTGTISLDVTGATAGYYPTANITIDAYGRVVAASVGSAPVNQGLTSGTGIQTFTYNGTQPASVAVDFGSGAGQVATGSHTHDAYVQKAGDTMTGNLTMSGTNTVTGLVSPTAATDAATKNYVDNIASGLGDITTVNAGSGLTGGGTSGAVTLNVNFGSTGTQAATGDHAHQALTNGTGIAALNYTGTQAAQVALETSGVATGYYPVANVTVDAYGRITAVSSGAAGVGTVTQVNSGAGLTGGPISSTGTLAVKYDDLSIGLNGNGSLEVKNVDASKIGDGTVSNTEFSYLNNATGELQAQIDNRVNKSGDTMTGSLSMSNNRITNVASPTAGTDAVNRDYVDMQIGATSSGDVTSVQTPAGSGLTGGAMYGDILLGADFGTGANQIARGTHTHEALSSGTGIQTFTYNGTQPASVAVDFGSGAGQVATGSHTHDAYVQKAGDTMTGNLTMSGTNTVTGLVSPTAATDAATKAYVDAKPTGTGTVTNVATGVGLIGGPITSTGTISLDVTGATAGYYPVANVTIDAYGRIVAASSANVALADHMQATNFGGTAQDSSAWTGIVRTTGGSWSASALTSSDIPSHTHEAYVQKAGDTMTGNLTMSGTNTVTGLVSPTAATDAATKAYVDAKPTGTGTVTNVATGVGLIGGPITSTGTISLDVTGATAGYYPVANVTIDAYGRIVAASSANVALADHMQATSFGGTAQDSSAWTGIVRTTGGSWSASALTSSDIPSHTHEAYVQKAGDTMTGNLTMSGTNTVTGLVSPTAATDAATKNYVDTKVGSTGTVTLVNSGAGLTGGPISSTGTLAVKYDDLSIGLNGNGSLEVKAGGINATHLASGSVTSDAIANGTITNVDINAAAAIDASKIGDGTVSNTEFSYLNNATGELQAQIDNRLNKTGDTMTGSLSMSNFQITNLASPTAGTDAVNRNYVDMQIGATSSGDVTAVFAGAGLTGGGTMGDITISMPTTGVIAGYYPTANLTVDAYGRLTAVTSGTAQYVAKTGDTMSGNLNMSSNTVTGLVSPTAATDAATKNYVDNIASGLGDITTVNAGSGLTGGGTSGAVTLNVNFGSTGTQAATGDHAHQALTNGTGIAALNYTGTQAASVALETSGVGAGYYPVANVTVDAYGRITAVSSGAAGVGSVTQINSGAGLTGGPISTVGTLAVKYDDLSIGLNGNGSLEVKAGGIKATHLATGSVTSDAIANGTITNVDINAAAAIDASKIGNGTIDNTEFSYMNNATGELQAQINNRVNKTGDTMTGILDMNNQRITNVASPTAGTDAVNRNYVDMQIGATSSGDVTAVFAGAGLTGGGTMGDITISMPTTGVTAGYYPTANLTVDAYGRITMVSSGGASFVSKTGDTMSGNLNMGSNTVTGLVSPTAATDAATKNYVDNIASGLGDITTVNAGTGLTGGGTSGAVTLNINFGTTSTQAATGDHAHQALTNGTGIVALNYTGTQAAQVALETSGVATGYYPVANVTVDAYGRITAVSSGAAGVGSVTQVNSGAGLTGGPISSTGTLAVKYDDLSIGLNGNGSLEVKAGGIKATHLASGSVTSDAIANGTITNVDINANAAIDASKIGDGTVSNTEFSYLNNTTGELQAQIDNRLNKTGDTMTGSLSMSNFQITNLASPTAGTDAVNRNYVDMQIGATSSGDVTAVNAGDGLTGGGTMGDLTLSVGAGTGITVTTDTVSLSATGVVPGYYTTANLTVDAFGRITMVSSGGANFVNKSGDTMSGNLNMGSNTVTGLVSPTAATDAATKNYVDNIASGLGDITTVNAGSGLTGGGTSGAVTLNVNFGSTGTQAATGDHAHQALTNGTGIAALNYTGTQAAQVALENSGVASGFYPVASITIDAYGRITAASTSSALTATTSFGGDVSGLYNNLQLGAGAIMNNDINASAAIDATKIADGTVNNTEFQYLNNVTGPIQTQINTKEGAITAGTTAQYWRGDKSWQDFNTDARNALSGTAPINYVSGTGVISLNTSGVTAGYYPVSNITVDAYGRITAASTSNAVTTARTVNTTAPLAGGGDLTTDRTLSLSYNAANLMVNGSNQLDTIQNISTTATPTFGALTVNGVVNVSNNIINNVSSPLADSDAANKSYVDTKVGSAGTVTLVNSGAGLTGGPISTVGTLAVKYDDLSIGLNGNGSLEVKSGGIMAKHLASGSVTSDAIANGTITNVDINANAAIDASKIGDGTVSNTEFSYLNNTTGELQAQINNRVNKSGDTMSGNLNMGSNTVTGLVSPTAATDAATKNYVDNIASGLGDITTVNAGSGLTGGGTSGAVTLNVNFGSTGTQAATGDHAHQALTNGTGIVALNYTGTQAAQVALETSGVATGYYPVANVTVDAYGRITAVSSGAAGVGSVTQVNSGAGLTGGPISSTGTLAVKYDDLSIGLNGNGSLEVKAGGINATHLASGSVTSDAIANGTITNVDINANAAIDASKIGDGTVSNTEFSYLNNATGELQAQINNRVNKSGDTMSGILSMSNNRITNVASPTAGTDAVNRDYVDMQIGATSSGDVTAVYAGDGLTGGGTMGDITLSVGAGTGITVTTDTVSLAASGVTAGFYPVASITVDAFGRITAASTSAALTSSTNFGGDVSGVYSNIQIGNGVIGNAEIDNAATFADVQNSSGASQFTVTDGSNTLRFAGSGIASVAFDSATHTVTIGATEVGTGDITAVNAGAGLIGGGTVGDVSLAVKYDDITIGLNGNSSLEVKDSSITSTKILDGTIMNADVNNGAAIAGTKINPDFGSQNVTTTGILTVGDATINGNFWVKGTSTTVDSTIVNYKLLQINHGPTTTALTIRPSVDAEGLSSIRVYRIFSDSAPTFEVTKNGTINGLYLSSYGANFNNFIVSNVASPVANADAANKNYVDSKFAGSGTITGVTAGNGLTGGGASGNVTLDIGAGNGITVNVNDVAVNPGAGITVATGTVSLSASGVTAGFYPVASVTVDAYGRITAASTSSALTATTSFGGDVSGLYNNLQLGAGAIMNNDINASAAIDATKIANGTVDNTEFQYLDGATGPLQTQINTKEPTITAGTTAQYWRGDKSWQTFATDARNSLSGTAPINYTSGTGVIAFNTSGVVAGFYPGASITVDAYGRITSATATSNMVSGTGTTNYNTYWSSANTLGSEQYVAASRGGLGASMAGASVGDLIYADSGTTYTRLAAGTSGYVLKANGAGVAPSWGTLATLTRGSGLTGSNYDGTGASTFAVDFAGFGSATTASRSDHNHAVLSNGTGIAALSYSGTNAASVALATSGVTAGFYPVASVTVDAYGRITAASTSSALTATTSFGGDVSGLYNNLQLGAGAIVNNDINASAAIDATKIADGSVSNTEFQYLDGATGPLQTQINTKEPTITAGTTAQYWRGDKSWQTFATDARNSLSGTSPINYTSGTGVIAFNTSGVVAGFYPGASITVDAYGRITSATATSNMVSGTGTTNYNTYWSSANTLGSEQYVAASRGGLGASMAGASVGDLIYADSGTTYTRLAAGTSGYVLKANGAGVAPSWGTLATLTRGTGLTGSNYDGTGASTFAVDFAGFGSATTASRSDHNHAVLSNGTGIAALSYSGTNAASVALATSGVTAGFYPVASVTVDAYGRITSASATSNLVTGSGTATRVAFWNGTNSLSSNANLYWDNGNSRLGVGNPAPGYTLDVVGVANFTPAASGANQFMVNKSNGDQVINYNETNNWLTLDETGTGVRVGIGPSTGVGINPAAVLHVMSWNAGEPAGSFESQSASGYGVLGNVPLATSTGAGVIGMANGANSRAILALQNGAGYAVYANANGAGGTGLYGKTNNATSGYALQTGTGRVSFETNRVSISKLDYKWPTALPGGTAVLTADAAGNLSWSTTIPGAVTGNGVATRIAYWSGTSALTSSSNLYWDNNNNRLGVGTPSPQKTLHVNIPAYGGDYGAGILLQRNAENDGMALTYRNTSGTDLWAVGMDGASPVDSFRIDNMSTGGANVFMITSQNLIRLGSPNTPLPDYDTRVTVSSYDVSGNTVMDLVKLYRDSISGPGNGIGAAISFQLEDSSTVAENVTGRISNVLDDVTSGSEDSSLRFSVISAGSIVERLRVDDLGLDVRGVNYTWPSALPAGTAVLTADAAGNLAWSTSFPGAITGSGVATRVAFWSGANSLSSNASLYWDNGNNRLGIGVTPSYTLDVGGVASFTPASSGANQFMINMSSGDPVLRYDETNNQFLFDDAGTGTKVGIGAGVGALIPNAMTALHVVSNSAGYPSGSFESFSASGYGVLGNVSNTSATGAGVIGLGNSTTSKAIWAVQNGTSGFGFYQSGSTTAKNYFRGNVGIGTTNPAGPLHVYSSASTPDALVVASNGYVGINTSNPQRALHIVGDLKVTGTIEGASPVKFAAGIRLANETDATAGNLRWSGTNFQGYNGSGWVNLDAAGSIGGSAAANKVAYGSGANTLTSTTNFDFNGTDLSVGTTTKNGRVYGYYDANNYGSLGRNGFGVTGWSGNNGGFGGSFGVEGTGAYGVYASCYSTGYGVYGYDNDTDTIGYLASDDYGAYGRSTTSTIYGGLGYNYGGFPKGAMGTTARTVGYLGDSAPNGDTYHAGVSGIVLGTYLNNDVAVAAYNENVGSFASLGGVHSGVYGTHRIIGVSGEAWDTTAFNTYGVIGTTMSPNGYGVYGVSSVKSIHGGLGVEGGKGAMGETTRARGYLGDSAPNGDSYHAGVTGLVLGGATVVDVAVAAYNEDAGSYASLGGSQTGVYGSHGIIGVSGEAWNTTAFNTYGLIGTTLSPNGYGVYGVSSVKTIHGGLGVEGGKGAMGETTRARGYLGDSAPNGDSYHAGVTGLVLGAATAVDVAVAAYNEDAGSYASLGGSQAGVFGSHARMGVSGEAWDTTGVNYGGIFTSSSTSGYGVYARAKATSGTNYGVYGITNNLSGYGAYGYNSSSATLGYMGSRFYGVYGQYNVSNYGVLGSSTTGVYGYSEAASGRAGSFEFFGTGGHAVYGYTEDGTSNGVYGTNGNNGNWGYLGGPQVGAYGAYDANNFGYMGDYGRGVHGQTNLTTGYGVYGYNASTANGGTAGYFKGGYYALSSLDLARGILVESRSNSITVEVVREYTIMDGTGDHIGVRALNARAATSGIITAGGYFSTIGGGSGASYGVMGGSSGLTGAGVYGGTSSSNNAAYGVYGEAARTSTYGILGNNLYGVGGTYNNATGPYGWLGTATAGLFAYAASPRWAISSSGRVHMTNLSPAGAGTVLVISATGEVYPQSSSRRYKKDIVDYQIEAAKVSQLRPVRFRWKETTATPNELDFGLIAEEVNEVFPDLVKLNQNGSPESVSYEKIGIILIKAYQEKEKALASQEAKTLKLEARTEEMARLLLLERTRNDALENRLKAIEATLKK